MSIKEIADRAGVSTTTVSLVLNGKPVRVTNDNRIKILEIAREIGYVKRTVEKKLGCIGVIVPDITNVYYAELIKGITKEAKKAKYDIFICDSNNSEAEDLANLHNLHQAGVEGIIMAESTATSEMHVKLHKELKRLFWSTNVPVVMIDRVDVSLDIHSVNINHYLGAQLATKYLLEQGHRNIGCLSGPIHLNGVKSRLEGYSDAMVEAGCYDQDNIVFSTFDQEEASQKAKLLLKKGVTAIFAMNDEIALGVFTCIKNAGLRIPEDISVVGYDDISFCPHSNPPLTTIRQPMDEISHNAVSLIVQSVYNVGDKPAKNNIVLQPELIIRESVAPPTLKKQ